MANEYNYNNTVDDETISRLVQKIKFNVPANLDLQITGTLAKQAKQVDHRRNFLWLPVTAALAASLIAVFLFLYQPPLPQKAMELPVQPISEIKTEMVLAEQNIKIIWVQKKDFKLKRSDIQ